MSIVMAISDLHLPYHVKGMYEFLKQAKEAINPDEVIFIGDVLDAYAFSRFSKDPDSHGPSKELALAKKELSRLFKLFPRAKVIVGNHEMRIYKRGLDAGIPAHFMKSVKELINAPKGIEFGDSFVIDGVRYSHGEETGGRDACSKLIEKYRKPCVIGHLHGQASIQYLSNGIDQTWAMVVGSLVDNNSIAMKYGRQNKDQVVLSIGVVDDCVPAIIPFKFIEETEDKPKIKNDVKEVSGNETKVRNIDKTPEGNYRVRLTIKGVKHEVGTFPSQISAIYALREYQSNLS